MSPLPEQDLNLDLAALASPEGIPSPEATVMRFSSLPLADDALDISAEQPTAAAVVLRDSGSEVSIRLRIQRLGELSIGGRGPTISAAAAYLLIVAGATGSAAAIATIPSLRDHPLVIGAVFFVVLVMGLWGHHKLR